MDTLYSLAFLGVVGSLCALIVKKHTPEIGMGLTLLVTAVIAGAALGVFQTIKQFMDDIASSASIGQDLLAPLYKLVGIAVVTKLCADMCRDAKETAVASAVEILGSVIGTYVSLPLISSLLQLVSSLL